MRKHNCYLGDYRVQLLDTETLLEALNLNQNFISYFVDSDKAIL